MGRGTIVFTESAGRLIIFLSDCFRSLVTRRPNARAVLEQIHFVGARSLTVIAVAGLFTGMVVALQFYDTLVRFGSVDLLGAAVGLSLIRELGPVMAALMVIARAGSAMCSEVAIMRSEEQFDALDCMAIDTHCLIMLPRLIAGVLTVPLLTSIFDVVGIGGGYVVGVWMQGVSEGAYLSGMADAITWHDIKIGLVKSTAFGFVITWIALTRGFYSHIEQDRAGAECVSHATTDAVVQSAIAMLFVDYFISALML